MFDWFTVTSQSCPVVLGRLRDPLVCTMSGKHLGPHRNGSVMWADVSDVL